MDFVNRNIEDLLSEIKALGQSVAKLKANQLGYQRSKEAWLKDDKWYKATSEKQPEQFCSFSSELIFTFVNEAYSGLFGKKPEELVGKSVLALVPEEYHNDVRNLVSSLTRESPVMNVEYPWISPDGTAHWQQWIAWVIFDGNGCLIEYQATGRDITERKEAEEQICYRLKLEEAAARASRILIDTGEANIVEILAILGEAVSVNRTYILWFREDGVTCDNTYEWCDPETEPQINNLQGLDGNSFPWSMDKLKKGENVIITDINTLPPEAVAEKEGFQAQGIYSLLMVPINITNWGIRGYMGFDDTKRCRQWRSEDVRCLSMVAEMLGAYWERKEAEKTLRESEAKFRTLTDTAPALIYIWSLSNAEGSLLYMNSAYQLMIGYSKERALEMSWHEFIHPDSLDLMKERSLTRLQGDIAPRRYAAKYLTANGEGRWGDFSANFIEWEGKPAVMGIIYDITERKQMEEELRQARDELEIRVKERTAELSIVNEKLQREIAAHKEAEQELILSEARYRAIIEDQTDMVVRALPDTTITYANEAYCRFYGKNHVNIIGTTAKQLIYEEDLKRFMEIVKSRSPEEPYAVITLRTIRADGNYCWQEWHGQAIYKNQSIVEYQAVGRDITERKKAEEALKQSEANFKTLADTSPALIFVFNEDRLLYMNSTAKIVTACSDEDMINMNPWDLVHPDFRDPLRQAGIARRKGEMVPPYEARLIGKNGSEIWGYLSADIIDYEGKEAILGVVIDISERKKMEEDLLQATKLESLGILAGGIAHDFNNILTVISGNISLAKMIMEAENDISELLSEVEKAAFQARDLTQQLLTFSKGGAPIKETASIQELLMDSASFVLRGSNVSCKFAISDDLWAVSIDKGQISQVVNNLIINADQAMPEGGSIELSAENIVAPTTHSLPVGNYIKISIKDQGIGILEKHLIKVFDPYFTTKQKGHGLGLATCYSIIKKHAGDIKISSEFGVGTTIIVYLPACPEEVVVKKAPSSRALLGQGKILIMDDEAIVRETLGRMLKHLGYNTVFASDGQEAIDLYIISQELGEPYDAVIMDLTIAGGMGGKEAVKRLLSIDSQAKVLVSSGYSNDPVMADFKKYGFCGSIPKPYEIAGVNQVLYEVVANDQRDVSLAL
ncbi:MAG: hypothetical protein CVU90_11095 [Firmicutes bacterium HGW-Firmicutes-15]|nr:MAG: hypothetical protein CVU90_11095 [Firmicutes bacterium HGW-Firmicutes-15]